MSLRIALTAVAALALAPGSPPAGAREQDRGEAPPTAPRDSPLTGEEVRFAGAGGLELAGTLVLPHPVPAGGAPALLLLPGSGPTDRDGNQPPLLVTDLLKQIAERLAAEGVASLRFDKRSARRHWGALLALDLERQNEFLGYASFVGDAAAGFAFLRGHDGVDPERAGILGHSEGGLLALQVAADTAAVDGAPRPAALVLAATGGVTLADLLRHQIGRSVQTYPEALRKTLLDDLERAIERIVADATVPSDLHAGLRPLFPANATRLLQSELAVDPAELAPAWPGPALLLHGALDVQVPAQESTERLRAAFARRGGDARCDVLVVPGASHNLKRVASEGEPGFTGEVVPAALDGLAAWVKDVLR